MREQSGNICLQILSVWNLHYNTKGRKMRVEHEHKTLLIFAFKLTNEWRNLINPVWPYNHVLRALWSHQLNTFRSSSNGDWWSNWALNVLSVTVSFNYHPSLYCFLLFEVYSVLFTGVNLCSVNSAVPLFFITPRARKGVAISTDSSNRQMKFNCLPRGSRQGLELLAHSSKCNSRWSKLTGVWNGRLFALWESWIMRSDCLLSNCVQINCSPFPHNWQVIVKQFLMKTLKSSMKIIINFSHLASDPLKQIIPTSDSL